MTKKALLKEQLTNLLEEKQNRLRFNKINSLFSSSGPYRREFYPKALEFFKSGKNHSQRAYIAANRVGKTLSAAYEVTCHLTGNYPSWWQGKRFNKPIDIWVAGETNETTRDVIQLELMGKIGQLGTGMIPKDVIGKVSGRPGVQNAIGYVQVKHVSGEWSQLGFKSYVQGWETFQGTKKDMIWLDEEPDDARIYTECLTRTAGTEGDEGILICTFTPLKSYSEIVLSFLHEGQIYTGQHPKEAHKYLVVCTWDDVPHLSEKWKEEMLQSLPPHLRDAKSRGIPTLGTGAVYPVTEEDIVVESFELPSYWPKAFGIEFGPEKAAVIWAAQDPSSKVIYLYSNHLLKEHSPPMQAEAIRARGGWMFGVGNPKTGGNAKRDGANLFDTYIDLGINVYPAVVGPNSKESMIASVLTSLKTGQLKVFDTCSDWLREYRTYRRNEKGLVVEEDADLMTATELLISHFQDIATLSPDEDDDPNPIDYGVGRSEITGY